MRIGRSEPGSRAAVLRRREETRSSSPSDDEVGGCKARSAPAMFAPPICRRSRRNASRTELILRHGVVSSDSTKTAAPRRTSQRAERAIRQSELGERNNRTAPASAQVRMLLVASVVVPHPLRIAHHGCVVARDLQVLRECMRPFGRGHHASGPLAVERNQ